MFLPLAVSVTGAVFGVEDPYTTRPAIWRAGAATSLPLLDPERSFLHYGNSVRPYGCMNAAGTAAVGTPLATLTKDSGEAKCPYDMGAGGVEGVWPTFDARRLRAVFAEIIQRRCTDAEAGLVLADG
ncbi:hypothetical protein ACQEVZ_27625 [Dactylosporangium sp. CA-152071]|uniref:hypothetical protein n=1 Tax=Dactylosporangium sp. CA-152071 TaxID=3239933 RepID=UPI003D934F53